MKLSKLFTMFLKINLLSTSGPASVGLLHSEVVSQRHLLSEDQFVQAVGLSSALPGSDALQLAMNVGYTLGGLGGSLIACVAAVLPPTVLMLLFSVALHRMQGQRWVTAFVAGITPVVAALIATTALHTANSVVGAPGLLLILLVSLWLFVCTDINPVLPLIAAGIIGVVFYR